MDFSYEYNTPDRSTTPKPGSNAVETDAVDEKTTDPSTPRPTNAERPTLQSEFAETVAVLQSTAWGAKLGGWWSTARKQGETYYETARKEAEKRESEATALFGTVLEKAKGVVDGVEDGLDGLVNEERKEKERLEREKRLEEEEANMTQEERDARALKENDNFIAMFKIEAAKKLQEVQKAEDAADEALARFGTNIRRFLQDAVTISSPSPGNGAAASEVLFESRDVVTGKRVIHSSRLDAQLHAIHTNPDSFTQDSGDDDGQYKQFTESFDVEKQTDAIAKDLEAYKELRTQMESLVPDKVTYPEFWRRYYFLRHVMAVQEAKRKEMLKTSTAHDDEEVGWDEDSDEEAPKSSTPQIKEPATASTPISTSVAPAETTTQVADASTLKPSRRSHDEKSVADSEASYDLVSGAASHAAGSPKEKTKNADDESDDDWE